MRARRGVITLGPCVHRSGAHGETSPWHWHPVCAKSWPTPPATPSVRCSRLAALPVLAADGAARSSDRHLGVWVFAATMLLVYASSSMYHAAPADHPTKGVLKRLDHASIYLFMAGTFTPFAIGHALGAPLLALVWTVAAAGVMLKLAGFPAQSCAVDRAVPRVRLARHRGRPAAAVVARA